MPGETKMASLIWKIEWYKYVSFPRSSFYSLGRSVGWSVGHTELGSQAISTIRRSISQSVVIYPPSQFSVSHQVIWWRNSEEWDEKF